MNPPVLSKTNKVILIIAGALFLGNSVLGELMSLSLVNFIGLSSSTVMSGLAYQFITYPFIETGFMSMLFNGLLLWFIGSELEQLWGERFYRKFLIYVVLFVGVVYFGVSLLNVNMTYVPLKGLDGINFALLIAYGIIYADRQLTFMLLFPMKAKYFCMILAGIEVYMSLFSPYKYSAWAHILAMGFAFTYLRYASMKAKLARVQNERSKAKRKSKLKLLKGEDDEPTTWH